MSAPDGTDRQREARTESGVDAARVRVAQVDLLRDYLPSILGGTLAAAVLVVGFVAWATDHDAAALGWLAAMVLVTLARAAYTVRLHRVATHAGNVEARIRRLNALIGVNAVLWAVLGWYAAGSRDPMITLVVVMVLVGLVASAVGFISHLRTMFLLYVATMILPMAARFAFDASDGLRWIGALLVLFVGISVQTSRVTARAVLHSLRLRFENLALVERLGGEIRRADAARAEAEAASRAKSVFLGAASHDLRQPLHSLRLLSTTLHARVSRSRAPDDDGETERVLVRRMDESVRALEALFDSILDVSRLDAGTLEANVEHVRLAAVLARVHRDFAPLAHLRGLEFSVGETAAVVRTDPVLLERLLGNLVANALRYTPRGSVRITIGGDVGDAAQKRVRVAVVDTGVGIATADQERVFEEFVQLGQPRARSQPRHRAGAVDRQAPGGAARHRGATRFAHRSGHAVRARPGARGTGAGGAGPRASRRAGAPARRRRSRRPVRARHRRRARRAPGDLRDAGIVVVPVPGGRLGERGARGAGRGGARAGRDRVGLPAARRGETAPRPSRRCAPGSVRRCRRCW